MSLKAHEHFCFKCYGHKTNGVCSGWWRCVDSKCVKPEKAICHRHLAAGTERTDPA
jgi:hypothetical protein